HDARQADEDLLHPVLVRRPADDRADRRLLRLTRALARRRGQGGLLNGLLLAGGGFQGSHAPASPPRRAASTSPARDTATFLRSSPLYSGRRRPFYARNS